MGWMLICLPWIAGLVGIAVVCHRTYQDGVHFVRAAHVFGWFLYLFVVGVFVYLPALVIAIGAIIVSRRDLRKHRRLGLAIFVVAASIAVPLGAWPAMSASFYAGRDAAYAALDYRPIYEACLEMTNQAGDERDIHVVAPRPDDNSAKRLPAVIARLSPSLEVWASRHAVFIQMDGGGPMYHEGISVAASDSPRAVAVLAEQYRRLDAVLPVFLCRLYDPREFFDKVERLVGSGRATGRRRGKRDDTPVESPVATARTDAAVCPKYIWQALTESGRGWTYNEHPSRDVRQYALALKERCNIAGELKTPYFFYDSDLVFRVYWYSETICIEPETGLKQLRYQFQFYEFDEKGKRTGSSGASDGFDTIDADYWLHKEGFP